MKKDSDQHLNTSRNWCSFFAGALFLILFITAGLIVLEWTENRRFVDNQRRSIVEKLGTIRAKLEGELNTELLLARSIITEVVTNTDITEKRFFSIAEHFMEASHHIRNIGLAKGTVLTYVYPIKGNEAAIGLDYTKIKSQWPAVRRVIEERKTVVAGPLELVQGGTAVIGRTPIYIDTGKAGNEKGTYFGILSVVINMPSLLDASGLRDNDSSLQVAIRGKDGMGSGGAVFYGPEKLFNSNPVVTPVKLPGRGNWLMAAMPRTGWATISPLITYYRIAAISVGLIIFILFFIQQREMSRRKKAEMEREKLIQELQKALSEVKKLSGFLPICSSCKKIRDDSGYWNQIESYIKEHSEADFSHSICPDCAKKLYPDLKIYE